MTQRKVRIVATGSYAPEKRLTNADLSKIVDTNDQWITERTGIKERRVAADNEFVSDLGAEAARRCLKAAGRTAEDVELLVLGTSSPDTVVPATAPLIQAKIGAWNAGAVDNLAACSGFVYSLSSAWHFVAGGQVKNALVIGSETLSKITNYKDRGTCIIFGDAAGAMFLEAHNEGPSDILYSKLGADGRGAPHIIVKAMGTGMKVTPEAQAQGLDKIFMAGREVYKFAVSKFVELIQDAAEKCGVKPRDIDVIVPHQVNLRIIESAIEKLGLDRNKVVINIDRYGNTSAASVPVAFDEAARAGRIKRGDLAVTVAFGAGLTWGSVALRW
jgi:3-oxoacyl-[acyl-carrier-protein] synthase-3